MISSIKGNVGHCEAASGAAGLAKLLLMFREKKIPAQAGFEDINPRFADLEASGLTIPRKTIPWVHPKGTPRRAMLNNFGAAGSNTALLLEEWIEPHNIQPGHLERSAYVFALSAKSQAALESSVSRYLHFLGKSERRPSLKDICYTATARRQVHDHRIAVTCSSIDDLRMGLEQYKVLSSIPAPVVSTTVFVFSGQGGMYQGMGEELIHTSQPFREAILACDSIVRSLEYPSILGVLCTGQSGAETSSSAEQIVAEHCAFVALEYAVAKMFMLWGVVPDCIMGHRCVSLLYWLSSAHLLCFVVLVNTPLCASRVR